MVRPGGRCSYLFLGESKLIFVQDSLQTLRLSTASPVITLRYIQPGKPNQNAFIERFNRTYREEVLNSYLFEDLDQVREITYDWLIAYNEQRPHDALGGLPPATFREQQTVKNSTYELSS